MIIDLLSILVVVIIVALVITGKTIFGILKRYFQLLEKEKREHMKR
ncbi:hypothetical protein AAEX37_01803 [Oligella sp. MSHR50489EDL]